MPVADRSGLLQRAYGYRFPPVPAEDVDWSYINFRENSKMHP
jgi:hypothetical protein